jgi:hypothetical protein
MIRLLPFLLALLLSACGGGGGSGDTSASPGTTLPSTQTSTGLTVSFSTSSMAFEYVEGTTPASQVMTASASGTTDKDLLVGAEVTGTGIALPIRVVIDPAARTGAITVTPASGLAAGTYLGTIKMLACTTQACTVQHGGSPHIVNYTVTVKPGLKLVQSSLSLAAVETGSPASSRVDFLAPIPSSSVQATVTYGSIGGWLSATVTGDHADVLLTPAGLVAGSYTAALNFSVPATGQLISLPVSLTVNSGLSVAETASLKVDSATSVEQMQGKIALAVAAGANIHIWTAASDQPWLKLAASSASIPAQPAWSIDLAAFGKLPNNAHSIAKVTIGTDGGLVPRVYTLDLQKALAEVHGLDALALLEGQSGDLLVYGTGFTSLTNPQAQLKIGGAQPASVTVLGERVLQVGLAALAAGDYPVSLSSPAGESGTPRLLRVTRRATYGYQAFDTEGRKSTMLWDAPSKSLFLVNQSLKSVMRYAPVGGAFQLVATRSFSLVDSIAMSPDHTVLIVQVGTTKILKLSPTDLSTQTTLDLNPGSGGAAAETGVPLPVMGDNRMLNGTYGWVDLDTGAVTAVNMNSNDTFNAAIWGAVSGNGLRMLRPDSGLTSPRGPMHYLDLLGDTFLAYSSDVTPFFYRFAVNHDGSSWAFNDQVFDFQQNLKGNIHLPDGWVSNQSVFARDGSRLYLYAQSDQGGNPARVYVVDTSRALTTTTNFPVLGFIPVADKPNCPYNSNSGYYDNCFTFETRITIADDDQTLFLAGDKKFVVLPIPPELRAAVSLQVGGAARVENVVSTRRR